MEISLAPFNIGHWSEIMLATFVAFIAGWIWYAPLFGKAWRKQQAHRKAASYNEKRQLLGLTIQVLNLVMMAWLVFWMAEKIGANGATTAFGFLSLLVSLNVIALGIFLGHRTKMILINWGYNVLTLIIFASFATYST